MTGLLQGVASAERPPRPGSFLGADRSVAWIQGGARGPQRTERGAESGRRAQALRPRRPGHRRVHASRRSILGAVFGIIFGAATVYLALKAGLTVSASIPIAVLSIAVFKKLGRATILENNIVQTIGSAGESIAAGVVFTMPALLFLSDGAHGAEYFRYLQIITLAAVGGILGVLFMVPLRRSLIVKEHGNLPYPEGTACADVLIVGEKGGNMAKRVFAGVTPPSSTSCSTRSSACGRRRVAFATGAEGEAPERHVSTRDHARVPRRRLHHRPAHRRRDGLRRRARRGWC